MLKKIRKKLKKIMQKWKGASLTDQIMAVATCTIAVATIAYTTISINQIQKLSDQISLSERQTKAIEDTLKIAKGTFDISQKSLTASKKATELEQSPQIIPDEYFASTNPIDLTKKNSFWLKLKNVGKSSAKNVIVFYTVKKLVFTTFKQNNENIEKAFQEAKKSGKASPQDIAPGAYVLTSVSGGAVDPFSTEEIAEVKKSKLCVLFTGGAIYYDIFGRKHETEFCVFYTGEDMVHGHHCINHNTTY